MFDEIVPSDIPKIDGIDRVIHAANSISPGPIGDVKRPWYMHPGQDDNLMVLQGTRYVDIYSSETKNKISFIVTPDKIYKNGKLYYDGAAMVTWPSGIFHRIISGDEGSISVNLATRTRKHALRRERELQHIRSELGDGRVSRHSARFRRPTELQL